MLGLLPDLPVLADFTDTCGTKPNCFTVIDTYSSSTVRPYPIVATQHSRGGPRLPPSALRHRL
jgi:hypothetical protein